MTLELINSQINCFTFILFSTLGVIVIMQNDAAFVLTGAQHELNIFL